MWIINDLDLKKQARELGVKFWQTPGFLFIILGVVTITIMTATYYISQVYDSPEVLVLAESFVVVIVLTIGNFVISSIEQMVRLNRMKSEFVSVVSHQLRTPLSAIRWETELLLSKFRKEVVGSKQRQSIENINTLSEKMTRLVNDLLDVARIDQGRLIIKKMPVNIVTIIEEAVSGFAAITKSRSIEVLFNDKKNIPLVFGDPEKLRMVVENLLNNSIKYTTNHGKIEIKLLKKGDFVIFSIKDTGVGIPVEQHERVFDKFFRSDNVVKYQTEGTGLGLYIAKNIIEQLNGKIWFDSVEGLGSIFSFSIPLNRKSKK
ncbi:MAG: HAMP domain-containing sensor histidine kinase [Candidatus Moranbacteria bacterium]|nr:HAMP domain-containing sensor histidine kinase [Candidatus Moranbacteria bacterium]